MAKAVLTISSKNYGAWALRGWLMCKLAGLDFEEEIIPPDDPAMKAEILLLASSMRVPALRHNGIHVWDTLAIGEYLAEVKPRAGLLPADAAARAHCRAICGEMHSGFSAMRGSLPMNIKGHFPGFKVWSRAQADIDRIKAKGNRPIIRAPSVAVLPVMVSPINERATEINDAELKQIATLEKQLDAPPFPFGKEDVQAQLDELKAGLNETHEESIKRQKAKVKAERDKITSWNDLQSRMVQNDLRPANLRIWKSMLDLRNVSLDQYGKQLDETDKRLDEALKRVTTGLAVEGVTGTMYRPRVTLVSATRDEELTITRPLGGALFLLDPTLRPEFQTLALAARGGAPGPLDWFVDDTLVGRDVRDGRLHWPLARGRHVIVARDTAGRSARTYVDVR